MSAGEARKGADGSPPTAGRSVKEENMKLEDFLKLTPEEQTAALTNAADMERQIAELEAERDSLKAENESLTGSLKDSKDELRKTKELNYTLARQVSRKPDRDAEETIHNMFKKEE